MKAALILILSLSCRSFSAAELCQLENPCNFGNRDKLVLTTTTPAAQRGPAGVIYFNNDESLYLSWEPVTAKGQVTTQTKLKTSFGDREITLESVYFQSSDLSITIGYQSEKRSFEIVLSTRYDGVSHQIYPTRPDLQDHLVTSVTWKNVEITCETAHRLKPLSRTSTTTTTTTTTATTTARRPILQPRTSTKTTTTTTATTEAEAAAGTTAGDATIPIALGTLSVFVGGELVLLVIICVFLHRRWRVERS